MIEIGTEVELFHLAEPVWRALIEPTLLAKWPRPRRWRTRRTGCGYGPRGSTTFRFDVRDPLTTAPDGCAVDRDPWAGL